MIIDNATGKNLNDEAKKGIKNATYDEMYFSSGDEEDENNVGGFSSKSTERRTLKTDDELLYDPKMDEDDLQWAMQQRNVGQSKGLFIFLYSIDVMNIMIWPLHFSMEYEQNFASL